MMTVGHHLRPTAITSRGPVPSLFLRCDFAFSAHAKQTNSLSHPILEGNDLFSHSILEDS